MEHPKTPPTDRQRTAVLMVCITVATLTVLDLTKVNVALPAIQYSLASSPSDLQFIVSGYVLAFGLALVPAGRLGDAQSRKLWFIIGVSLFTVASIVCALAPSALVLLIARLAQGIGAGIQMPQVFGVIQQLFTGASRGKAFGALGAALGSAIALGPTIGGLCIALGGEEDGWRWIFWMNVPLGAVVLFLLIRLLPATPIRARRVSLDPVGNVLFASAITSLLVPFLSINTVAWPRSIWLLIPLSAVFVITFIRWERTYEVRGNKPLIPPSLFRYPTFRNGITVSTLFFTALPCNILLATLFLQEGLYIAPVFAGMITIGYAVAKSLSSWLSGRRADTRARPLITAGLTIMLLGSGLLVIASTAPESIAPWLMAVTMLVTGAGGGMIVPANQTLTLSDIPVQHGGVAASIGQLGQRIGGAIGLAIATSVYFGVAANGAPEDHLGVYRGAYALAMTSVMGFFAVALIIAVRDQLTDAIRRRRQRASRATVAPGGE